MNLIINNSSQVPIYEQIAGGIRESMAKGELKENDALPSVRALSSELRISSLTVKKAYDKLEEQGLVTTVHGKGTYVRAFKPAAGEPEERSAEEELLLALKKAKSAGLSRGTVRKIIDILLED